VDVAQRFQMTEHDLTGIEIRAKVQYALRRGSRTTQIAVANATLRARRSAVDGLAYDRRWLLKRLFADKATSSRDSSWAEVLASTGHALVVG